MKIINQSKNIVISANAEVADTVFKRMKGLLGKRHFTAGDALILKHCNSVHTFFMRFPIDLLFTDKNQRVVKIAPSLNPYRLSGICLNARLVIELPAGTIQTTATEVGDTLSLE